MLLILILAITAFAGTQAYAWDTQGHQVVAMAAEQQLTRKARAEVEKLLALNPEATLASISTWADEHRNPTTASWHYVNFPRDSCTYDRQRDCPDGNCVVEATNRQLAILASDAADDKRLSALRYVVHLVADVQQPLHAGYAEDRGGNTYQLQAFGRGTNLHALWDTGLIKNVDPSSEGLAAKVVVSGVPEACLDSAHAAEEPFRIVGAAGLYRSRRLGVDNVERFTQVAV